MFYCINELRINYLDLIHGGLALWQLTILLVYHGVSNLQAFVSVLSYIKTLFLRFSLTA
jgi:hypothetical protein